MRKRTIVVLTALHLSVISRGVMGQSSADSATSPVRMLFLGNSYTYFNELPRLFQVLAISAGQDRLPEIHAVLSPGAYLRTHWQDTVARGAIARGKWNYVMLQTQSREPIVQLDTTLKYARLLKQEVDRLSGRVLLFQHWARKNEPDAAPILTQAFASLGSQISVSTVPIGPAFELLGRRDPAIELYRSDNSHPSGLGTYLAACVIYSYVYGASPVGLLPYTFETTHHSLSSWDTAARRIPNNVARLLQQTAWEVVQTHKATTR